MNIPVTPPPVRLLSKRPDVAIVLGSGGARGYAHIGVLSVLRSAGVPIDLVTGASAGSVIGALYADHGRWQDCYRAMLSGDFWTFADISTIPRLTGIMTGDHLEEFLLKNLSAANFRSLKIPLAVATTDIVTGNPYFIRSGPIAPAVKASSSIPGVVQPSVLYSKHLVDGGVVDPIPVDLAKLYHPKLIIAVNIDKQFEDLLPSSNIGILGRSIIIMRKHLAARSAKGADIIITPQLGQAGTFDVNHAGVVFQEGQQAAQRALPKILRLMKKLGIKKRYPASTDF